ncbi:16S rRNA (guanine(527)-N(7))-methyltransferase RsmG [Helicobacter pametensis]|uniref:16S rRNA (guanine(527)-N(7))-methyltransferase RsmG n=1 Tax=Helicobacter pametensis TaxID=95149 RepID=UPI0004816864|nr:16S rRNA (guanine(527)-N(7))-methyltransferase RsmG [Helicobacter pametensis]
MNAQFQHYKALLLKWNKTHNLSGAKNETEVDENIKDCLYPLEFIAPFANALDIGSGCGFPAIPLAIALPQSMFYLTEPRKKRASFLQMLCFELKLDNVCVFPTLVQDAKIPSSIDLITSRAVAQTPLLIQISRHLLNPWGAFLFYKGSNLLHEGEEIGDNEIFTSPSNRVYFYRRLSC